MDIVLYDVRKAKWESYNFGGVIYAIRCMIHENENLNVAEYPDYHVLLDWSIDRHGSAGVVSNGRLICNANFFWWRLREVLAKFLLGLEMFMAFERGDGSCSIHSRPPLKSVFPGDGRHSIRRETAMRGD